MAYPPITTLPAAPSRQDPANFADEADAFLGALPTFATDVNAMGAYLDGVAVAVDADATIASAAKEAAVAAAGATAWVSGASYAAGDVVWSLVNFLTYRAQTTHSGVTTDPSADTTNWVRLSGIDGLTATAAELNYNDITTLGTSQPSKVVTADANGDVNITEELKAKSYNETFVAVTSTSNATTVNCEDANNFSHTLTENTTFTFSNPPSTETAYGFTLKIVQDASASGYTVTWPASIDWPTATAPILTGTASAVDIFVFYTHDGGTNWYGFVAGQDMATPA